MLQKEALEIMKMGYNVYLTGEAGTGKTYILNSYINFLKSKHIPVGITASTGIAATHLDGVTIDSWSGLGMRDSLTDTDIRELSQKFHLKKRLLNTKVLIIDEISMIHGSRFDAIDRLLRKIRGNNLPFGGLQVILCGDLFQLPPVTRDSKYIDFIFKSNAWQDLDLRICYLHEARRHNDSELIKILQDIRQNKVSRNTLEKLLVTSEQSVNNIKVATKLYTHNIDVDAINKGELDKIEDEPHIYNMTFLGPEKLVDAMKKTCLAPEVLELKKNALVMFVRNNYKKGYVNGTLGKVVDFNGNGDPIIKTLDNRKIHVEQASWTLMDGDKIIAQLTQVPIRLAWAITIHKSQGMTLDAAEIDLSKSFIEGMGYVALSRVKSLKGLKLLGINDMAFRVNREVSEIDKNLISISKETVMNLKKMGFLRRWMKKRKFMYKLTSQ